MNEYTIYVTESVVKVHQVQAESIEDVKTLIASGTPLHVIDSFTPSDTTYEVECEAANLLWEFVLSPVEALCDVNISDLHAEPKRLRSWRANDSQG